MNKAKIFNGILVFVLGFLSCMLAFYSFAYFGKEMPLGLAIASSSQAPGNWVAKDKIHVYENAVVIDIEKASISEYAPTGSMKPVLDENSNGIRIVPKSEEQIKIGDIVSFEQGSDLIVHRVVEIGEDDAGKYFVTKGDSNNVSDGKIRFKDIKYVTIGVIW